MCGVGLRAQLFAAEQQRRAELARERHQGLVPSGSFFEDERRGRLGPHHELSAAGGRRRG
jgi:hypothetical protein